MGMTVTASGPKFIYTGIAMLKVRYCTPVLVKSDDADVDVGIGRPRPYSLGRESLTPSFN